MKKLLSIILALIIVCASSEAYATTKIRGIKKFVDREIHKSGYNLESRILTDEESDKLYEKVMNNENSKEFKEKLADNKYANIERQDIESIIITDKLTNDKVVLLHRLFQNNSGDIVFVQFMYLPDLDYLVSHISNKICLTENAIEEFSSGVYIAIDEKGNITGYDIGQRFTWPSFPQTLCWMGEALACGVYCGAIGVVNIPAGAVCGVVCGGLFLVACSGF
ncbi:putative immunity/bacteriocin fusion bifunctional protein [Microaceticoccus formicicus]|uniref:putative immunity/bacteriocin fusion bifunctional protein n=1 Tax=Microaceticoccus formicicus TaxID=3118105 RepID=UPI003CD0007D|nr:putative immunity/bacteriocin fusion bifunctional protein [Peptoniphilaceae bacterium AMB_02]